MNNFSYFKITKSKKIRYLKILKKKGTYIVFLHGFMSDLDGKKPKSFLNFSKKNNMGFLALEYSGHGKSSGKFTDGNISKWSKETSLLIKKIVKKNDIIIIGSSMGAWIALNQILKFKKQIKGFMGIGSAPEFLENLITIQLLKDGRKNKILHKKIHYDLKIVMLHGSKDTSVPVIYSKRVLKIFKSNKKKLVIIKNGDHSLSSPKSLKILKKELSLIIN